ncbi:unnamed protein product [Heligmosomoides polygyrus]|uniref:Reverse transcriptase domain-containing protein n=1 Tax=Heligmosomoides polygyrus TaxID=6339 RepID=A0A3P7WJ24_HELPZ|nr:unnamed protein product [Heligmosomoides polygyrus]
MVLNLEVPGKRPRERSKQRWLDTSHLDLKIAGQTLTKMVMKIQPTLFTRVILNRISRTLDEGQPREQAGFRRGFSTIDHIHTITKLIEVSREYKLPLCLTFIDLKKAFDSVETEAVHEALCLTFIDLKKAFDSVETEAVMEALLIALRS